MTYKRRVSALTRNLRPEYPPLVWGKGSWVRDVQGKRFLDGAAQTFNLNLGHRHPAILSAVEKQLQKIDYASSRYGEPTMLALAEELVRAAPKGLSRVNLRMTGGSEATECAIKSVRVATGRSTIAAAHASFFGETLEAMRISGNYPESALIFPRTGAAHLRAGPCFDAWSNEDQCTGDCSEPFERLIEKSDDVAAVFVEPVNVNAGVIFPEKRCLQALRTATRRNKTALVFDEVQTTFGWTGSMTASHYFGVTPDILTAGKALAGGFPLGAALLHPRFDVLRYGEHEFTHGGTPVTCAAALATLEVLRGEGFLNKVVEKGNRFRAALDSIPISSGRIKVRAIGLVAGIDFISRRGRPQPAVAARVARECRARGLLVRVSDVGPRAAVILKPPLTTSERDLARMTDIVTDSVKGVLSLLT